MNKLPSTLILAAAFAVVVAGCTQANGEKEQTTTDYLRVETLMLHPREFEDVVELTGSVEAIDDATLSAQAGGTIEYIADLGTPVKRGAVVARLDDDEAQAAVAQTKAQLETAQSRLNLAQSNYNRLQPLYRDSVISAQEFENTQSQLQQAKASQAQAQAQLASAQQRLENTRLRAPFSGTVEEQFFELGEQVSPGQQVVRVVDVTPAKIRAGVPERYAGDIERSSSVTARFKAYGDFSRPGQVTFVGSTIDTDSRTFPIEVNIENNDRRLKPEMVVQLYLTRAVLQGAIVIPRGAVIRDERGTSVYTVRRRANQADTLAVAQSRNVRLGPTYGERAVVESGLQTGDRLVIAGQNDLAPGDTVLVTKTYDHIPAPISSLEEQEPPS